MTFTLPVCQLCNKEVTGSTATTQNIFAEGGMQQTFFTITLSCGCVVEYPAFDVDVKNGTQTLKDGFTGQVILTYDDDEMLNDGDYGDDE